MLHAFRAKGVRQFGLDHRFLAVSKARRNAVKISNSVVAATTLAVFTWASLAQGQVTMTSFELVPGVVVDLSKDAVYVMRPQGGVVAIDLSDGKEVWHTDAAAKPLAVSGDMVVSQAEPEGDTNKLKIVSLSTEDAGRTVLEKTIDLPPAVKVRLNRSLGQSFRVDAKIVGGEVSIAWEYEGRLRQGIRPGGEEGEAELPPDVQRAGEDEQELNLLSGAFRLNLRSGAVTQQRPERAVALTPPTGRAIKLTGKAKLAGMPEPQFLSADGQYVMHPKRLSSGSSDDKYLWTIYDRNTGERLGEFKTRVRYAPFFGTGPLVVYQIGRSERKTSAGLVQEPIQIRAVDLRTGQIAWSQEIRDLTERGPVPK